MVVAPNSAAVRAHAARAILQVVKNSRTIDWVQRERPQWCAAPLEKELIFGTVRHYPSLKALIESLLPKPTRAKDQDVFILMLVGAYQLLYTNIPTHAAINETVQGAVSLHKPWAKGLLNAVLRTLSKRVNAGDSTVLLPDRSFDHPSWLVTLLRAQYPQTWADILTANNSRAPLVLRINGQKITRDAYAAKLGDAHIGWTTGMTPDSLILDQPQPGIGLPGWIDGEVAIQDMGAQFAVGLLKHNAEPVRVLDACAAPGGKLAHLLERLSTAQQYLAQTPPSAIGLKPTMTAIDVSVVRIKQAQQIIRRLGHDIDIKTGNACTLEWWDGIDFSHILLDAPCSGTGTIRRHPDIKLLLRADAVPKLAAQQLHMLNNLWQTLAPGGNLLYCTCSLLSAENDDVVGRFLKVQNKDASVYPLKLPTGVATQFGWQLLPTDPHTDGFYYSLLCKEPVRTKEASVEGP